jgi:hypothetical protein
MLGNRKIALHTFCEISNLIKPYADEEFWDFSKCEIIPGAIYIFGQQEFQTHKELICQLVRDRVIYAVLCNPAEGSEPMMWLYRNFGLEDLIDTGHIAIITGGHVPEYLPHLYHEHFLTLLLDYDENIQAIADYQQLQTVTRPYKFLFLNGRARPQRKYLIQRFKLSGLINESLWSNLDDTRGISSSLLLLHNNVNIAHDRIPIQYLPPMYEVDRYQSQAEAVPPQDLTDGFYAKHHLFNREWGEIYLTPKPYLDTYFSLVTETVFDYPHAFRTEKIWKPIAIGHPFIVASTPGFYKSLHNLGFKTFGHLIDESFDQLDNAQDRVERIAAVVEDLCSQDLPGFLAAAEEVCKYNQLLMLELCPQIRQEFPQRFEQFIHERFRI